MKCTHSLVEREEAATVDGRCPLCPPFDVDKVADSTAAIIAQNVASYMQAFKPEPTPSARRKIAAIIADEINRAINGEGK
jgi:hypothetical protein